jgi:hypothetical protein
MGTLFVDKLDPQSGTSLELGSSGDTITIPSGATITNNGTQTGFGGTNTPAFYVTITSDQTVSDNVKTKVSWTNEVYDTNSAFASDKFTVPSEQAGKYNFYVHLTMGTTGSYGVLFPRAYIYKNGSSLYMFSGPNNEQGNDVYSVTGTLSLDLSVGDYIEVYGRNNNDQGTPLFLGKAGDSPNEERSWFGGYKVIT